MPVLPTMGAPMSPYGRTRWVEYPTPKGIWAIEQNYDASMVRVAHAELPEGTACPGVARD